MEQENLVKTVTAGSTEDPAFADYFIEKGIIHANIAGGILLTPLGNCSAANTVKVLLTSYLLQRSRKK